MYLWACNGLPLTKEIDTKLRFQSIATESSISNQKNSVSNTMSVSGLMTPPLMAFKGTQIVEQQGAA